MGSMSYQDRSQAQDGGRGSTVQDAKGSQQSGAERHQRQLRESLLRPGGEGYASSFYTGVAFWSGGQWRVEGDDADTVPLQGRCRGWELGCHCGQQWKHQGEEGLLRRSQAQEHGGPKSEGQASGAHLHHGHAEVPAQDHLARSVTHSLPEVHRSLAGGACVGTSVERWEWTSGGSAELGYPAQLWVPNPQEDGQTDERRCRHGGGVGCRGERHQHQGELLPDPSLVRSDVGLSTWWWQISVTKVLEPQRLGEAEWLVGQEGLTQGFRKRQEKERRWEATLTHSRRAWDLLQVEWSWVSLQIPMWKGTLLSEVLRVTPGPQLQGAQQRHHWRQPAFSREEMTGPRAGRSPQPGGEQSAWGEKGEGPLPFRWSWQAFIFSGKPEGVGEEVWGSDGDRDDRYHPLRGTRPEQGRS